jgi:NAD(P)-dependent dehydrogenase (short-subunit alcohol dehydrogenase family)
MATAVVTGAGRGIGRAIARRLADDGHSVVTVDINEEAVAEAAAEVGGSSRCCDVSDPVAVRALGESLDGVDILINDAAIWRFAAFLDISPEDAQSVFAVNVLGLIYCAQAFLPGMIARRSGVIINVSAAAAEINTPGIGVYPASKAAVVSLTKQMALEFGRYGIRVNAVSPGLMATEQAVAYYGEATLTTIGRDHIPLCRPGDPRDVADVVAFLVSDQARYITGQVTYIDGGTTAGRQSR